MPLGHISFTSTSYYSPRGPVHPASTGYFSNSPLHGVLFNHPSMGYCSSSPPPATVQPALHWLLFNMPSTGSCSSSPPRGHVHPLARSIGVLFIQRQRPLLPRGPVHPTPHRELFIQTPSTTLTVHQGKEAAVFDRLQLEAVAKESLGFS